MAPVLITEDYYMILRVEQTASTQQIIKSYRKLARTVHPDHNKSPSATEAFQRLGEAYEALKDETKRRAYDLIYHTITPSRPSPQTTQTPRPPPASTSRPEAPRPEAPRAGTPRSGAPRPEAPRPGTPRSGAQRQEAQEKWRREAAQRAAEKRAAEQRAAEQQEAAQRAAEQQRQEEQARIYQQNFEAATKYPQD